MNNLKQLNKMKNIKLILIILLIISCKKNSNYNEIKNKQLLYHIQSFSTVDGAIDINNDGITNTDILYELTNYSKPNYDLRIISNKEKTYYDMALPSQYIDSNGHTILVDFESHKYSMSFKNEINLLENYKLDSVNKIIRLKKISQNKYNLILRKKLFDFNSSQIVEKDFLIDYIINN